MSLPQENSVYKNYSPRYATLPKMVEFNARIGTQKLGITREMKFIARLSRSSFFRGLAIEVYVVM
jgi:hypothetical protein